MPSQWSNKDNAQFYEHNVQTLQHWAELGGLANCPDLIAIKPYLERANTILEVGPGCGRVINYLCEHYPDKALTAVEQSRQLYDTLEQKYSQHTLVHADIAAFNTTHRYDLILWLWSGITDFSQAEQLPILRHVSQLLSPTGTLIIETFPHDLTPANGSTTDTQSYNLTANDLSLQGYIPSPEEMQRYATTLSLKYNNYITYTTESGRERKLYPLQK